MNAMSYISVVLGDCWDLLHFAQKLVWYLCCDCDVVDGEGT